MFLGIFFLFLHISLFLRISYIFLRICHLSNGRGCTRRFSIVARGLRNFPEYDVNNGKGGGEPPLNEVRVVFYGYLPVYRLRSLKKIPCSPFLYRLWHALTNHPSAKQVVTRCVVLCNYGKSHYELFITRTLSNYLLQERCRYTIIFFQCT